MSVQMALTWIIVHEVVACLVALWSKAIHVEGMCFDSICKRDGFCPVRGEGVPTDVEFDEGFLEYGERVTTFRVYVRMMFRRFVRCVGYV